MNFEEKVNLTFGLGWEGYNLLAGYYVGSVPGIPRLGVPGIWMQDAAQGFRTSEEVMIGQVTSWPCSLAVAATWDADLMFEWGQALGNEHSLKGSNVILGPSVNVHRVPQGGRNGEYISGESPYLGAVMTAAYVRGVQSQNVSAVVKHYGFNNQETNRDSVDVYVDERTAFEVYYPPYKAAIDAGVGAFMCSYNLVNGSHSCGSEGLLHRDLKLRMQFGGFVMSDWWAVHNTSYQDAGLDMDMPGNDGYFSKDTLTDPERLDNMVTRIVTTILKVGMTEKCAAPDCTSFLEKVVATSEDHANFARAIAAQSVALLKNDNNLLPISADSQKLVAVVGSACDAPNDIGALLGKWDLGNYYTLGGSGRVIGADPVSILRGLQEGTSWKLSVDTSDIAHRALNTMEGADLAIICVATTSSEAHDRQNLVADQERFVSQLLELATIPTVVLITSPGTMVTPWAQQATAILNMFLGGQETGRAWFDILTGATNPSGKLPVTFLLQEADATPPCTRNPCNYDEGLMVGWRAMEGKDVAFPFGHGLSYTNFSFEWTKEPNIICGDAVVCMEVQITNIGGVAGAEVAQLYVEFPASAGEPAKQLKGFKKTIPLKPGASSMAYFNLTELDLSTWVVGSGWQQAKGKFNFFVGSSSRVLPLTGSLEL